MRPQTSDTSSVQKPEQAVPAPPPKRPWIILALGLTVWMAVQSFLVSATVHERSLPPEPKDALTYILKTKQLQECPRQDCPALDDLDKQFSIPSGTNAEETGRRLAYSKIFPVYHPLYSTVLLVLNQFGFSLMEAHNFLWTLGPLIFGTAFAYLLVVLWGPGAAGLALLMLAFTVFPDTGIHHVVPSNLAMAIGCLVWARIISRRGESPWTLVIGTCILVTTHPIGMLYSVIAVSMACVVSGFKLPLRTWVSLGVATGIVGLYALALRLIPIPGLVGKALSFHGGSVESLILNQIQGTAATLACLVENIVVHEIGLFGSLPLFCMLMTVGFLLAPSSVRRINLRVSLLYSFFVVIAVFTISSHPADILFRMWIPLPVILTGAVGYGLQYCILVSLKLAGKAERDTSQFRVNALQYAWPVIILALGIGFILQRVLLGGEQILAMKEYLLARQPVKLCASQTEKLLSEAKEGDRVLYASNTIMPYYFIHGAMRLGAVYYHQSFEANPAQEKLISRDDLRFAVLYNPMVYHPAFKGVPETLWWITRPSLRFSPLDKRWPYQPLSRDGAIYAADFKWIDVRPGVADFSRKIRIWLSNPGKDSSLEVIPISGRGDLLPEGRLKLSITSQWNGWKSVEFPDTPDYGGFRLSFPMIEPPYLIEGIVFGDEEGRWPWAQKTSMTFMPSQTGSDPITIKFDASAMLPKSLRKRDVTVIDDCGSSVLLKISP